MPRLGARTILTTVSAVVFSMLAAAWGVSIVRPRLPSQGLHVGSHRLSLYHGRILFTSGDDPARYPSIDATTSDLGPAVFFSRTGDTTNAYTQFEVAISLGRGLDHTP